MRLLYRRIYDAAQVDVVQAEKHWSCKIDHVLDKERGALERCEVEGSARRSRVLWFEQVKADNLQDRNHWRTWLDPLPVWKKKFKKHAKRKANSTVSMADKRRKISEASYTVDPKDTSPEPTERRVRLISEFDED